MTCSIRTLTAALALAASSGVFRSALAQSDSGTFVIRHAGDTVATERFSRTATSLKGTLAIRNAKRTSQNYQVVVAPDASVALIQMTVRESSDSGKPDSGKVEGKVVQRARVIFKEDSAAVDDVTNNGLQTRVFGTGRGAVPYLNLSFALLEQVVRRARAAVPAAVQVPLFNLGGGQTVEGRVLPLPGDSVVVAIGSIEFHLKVDSAGRVLGGSIPKQQVVADRVAGS